MHPLAVSGANDFNVVHDLAPWLWASGGDFLDETGSEPAIGRPAAIDGIDRYQRLVATYNHPAGLSLGVHDVTVGASVGVALGGVGADPDQLLSEADHRMYQQKRGARSRALPPSRPASV